jgi:tagaturonate epimerase
VQEAERAGVVVVPVWNKSFREHSLIGTKPDDVRVEADDAVKRGGWKRPYHVDADHIGVKTVDGFLAGSDFYTLDVADFIGKAPGDEALAAFVRDMAPFRGPLRIPGVDGLFEVTEAVLERIGRTYLSAVMEAGRIYRHVAATKGARGFIAEVSTDEATAPQFPVELYFILAALSREKIPVQTIAPKFSGKFLKGIDYVGDVGVFARELEADLCVVKHAIDVFSLPRTLKLSVHTGSDKFSLYPIIRRALAKHGAGLHLKTAGTTWLEEVIGVALCSPAGLAVAKRIYLDALPRYDELCQPYATVIEIDRSQLPPPGVVETWTGDDFVRRLRHDQSCSDYDPNLRQLIHVAFRLAAEMGPEWRAAEDAAAEIAGRCVTDNLFHRHIRPLFLGS